jgi:hypothetical protein
VGLGGVGGSVSANLFKCLYPDRKLLQLSHGGSTSGVTNAKQFYAYSAILTLSGIVCNACMEKVKSCLGCMSLCSVLQVLTILPGMCLRFLCAMHLSQP